MLSGLAQTGAKALGGSRFSLANLAPATFLVVFIVVLATSGLYTGGNPRFADVTSFLSENAGLAVLAAFGVFILAVLLRPFQAALVQVLEGYWSDMPGLSSLAEQAEEHHRRKLHRAIDTRSSRLTQPPVAGRQLRDVARAQRREARVRKIAGRANRIIARYPLPIIEDGKSYDDRLLPTLLGNTLRDGEDNAGRRYGLQLQVVAPRLYPSVSGKLDSAISQSLDLIDTTAAFCVSFALAGVASLPLIARWDAWSLVPVGTVLMSGAAYRGAVQSARGHASLLAAAVDLHRFDMVRALHYPLPANPIEERAFNRRLTSFLKNRNPAVERLGQHLYEHPTEAATQPPPGAAGSSAPDGAASE